MTPGNNGEHTPNAPEGDEDVFGYLYEDGQAAGATPPSGGGGYGYPGTRSSYNQVRAVGDRRPNSYGPQAATTYGQVPQQQAYGQPNTHYAAPETQPGKAPTTPQYTPASRGSGGRGSGPNTKGLLIAAIAVVAVVAIGIAAAMTFGGGGDGDDEGGEKKAGGQATQAESVKPSEKPTKEPADPAELPKTDAKALKLEGGTTTASDIEGAESEGGVYVTGFDKVGAQVTWTVNGIPKAGSYSLRVNYGVPGKDSNATILVNGKKQTRPLNMGNFSKADEGDWEKGWTNTWAVVQLTKGTNAVTLSCAQSDLCGTTGANIDQMWLVEGDKG
ncbi:carbohydrate-binding protein [Streptomyces sp. NPDC050147]|uniref:carbohydrate-binding protein n=1 Tax=Streptomyces sp. NPDC050147 TaxID=3155513 RepID=UPI0034340DD0